MNSVATAVFTAHTVLQGSQQGDETSIQHVSAIVQTHQVAVEHPAELQTEWAHLGPVTTACVSRQPDRCTCRIIVTLPSLCLCTSPPFGSPLSCSSHIKKFQKLKEAVREYAYIWRCWLKLEKVWHASQWHQRWTDWRPAPALLGGPAGNGRNTGAAGPHWALSQDGQSTAVSELSQCDNISWQYGGATLTHNYYVLYLPM